MNPFSIVEKQVLRRICLRLAVFLFSTLANILPVAVEAKTAYLGIAGAGEGQGALGHSFLVIGDRPSEFLTADVYQYAIKIPQGLEFSFELVRKLSSFPFVVDKGPAWRFIKSYTREDRAVLIYELNLSQAQIETLVTRIEADRDARQKTVHVDYSIDANNCATKLYDMLNSVLPSEHWFRWYSPLSGLAKFQFFRPREIAMAVPIGAAPMIAKHPLVKNVVRFRAKSLSEVEVGVVAFDSLNLLFDQCHRSQQAKSALTKLYGNVELRETKAYLDLFSGLFAGCSAETEARRDRFNEHLDFLRMSASDLEFLALSKKHYLSEAPIKHATTH